MSDLDATVMVEKAIRDAKSHPTRQELLKSLPRQVSSSRLDRILGRLEGSNKIVFSDREIIWVFPDNPKLKRMLETSIELR